MVKLYPELTLPEYLNSETLVSSRFRGNDLTSLFTGVTGFVTAFLLLLLCAPLPSVVFDVSWSPGWATDEWFGAPVVDAAWVVRTEIAVVCLVDGEDEVVLLFAVEELVAAWVVKAEVAEVCWVEGEVEVELLSAVGEELDVALFGTVDDKIGVLEVLCPPDDETVVTVASTGWAGSLLILRFRKSLPYLSIVILKN